MLTAAFAGQAFAYYGLTAWLPTVLTEEQGLTSEQAGAASSIIQVSAVLGALLTPIIINHLGPLAAFLTNGVLWCSLPVGLIFAPDLWAVWSVLAGNRTRRRLRRDLHDGGPARQESHRQP